MPHRKAALFIVASLVAGPYAASPVRADNPMGYQLLSPQTASNLPRNRGSLGMGIERAQQITDGGMTFDIIRVRTVQAGSPGAQAGFRSGDQIIAVDGHVFSSLMTFAAYVGSVPPGTVVNIDYIPMNGGPAQAQRVAVTVGAAGGGAPPAQPSEQTGTSSKTRLAIGVGAAALLGCLKVGCFSHPRPAQLNAGGQPSYQ